MLATNPRISQLAGMVKHYAPLKPKYSMEMVRLLSTIDKFDALPQWLQEHLLKVEQMFEDDKANVNKHLAGKHDQSTHGRGRRASVESPSFTDDEFDAISSYSGSATVQVNHHLRGLSKTRGIQPALGVWRLSDKKIEGIVKEMDSAIDKSTLAEDITLQRYVPTTSLRSGLFGSVKGKTISDKGFLSMRKGRTEGVPPPSGFVTMRIKAPKGTKALDLSFINPNAMGEVIFPRNTQIKVTNIIGTGDDTTVIGEIVNG